jgi:polyisoprenoid-binding protein YceI
MNATSTIGLHDATISGLGRLARLSIVGLALAASTACDDPAKGKTKALTTEATAVNALSANAGAGTQYDFDQNGSKVEWTGSKVTGKHLGGFKTFSGKISVPDHKTEAGAVNVDIDATSLYTDSEKLEAHLKSADFFDVAKFPKASFVSTSIKPGGEKGATHTVTGNLTLHGVTRSVTFPAVIKTTDSGVDADAEFAINRKDFGLVYAGKPDDLIRDDVVIKLTIHSRKKSP